MNIQAFHALIGELGLSSFREELERMSQPCLDFLTERADTPVPSCESKIGGMPDLPAGMVWPVTRGNSQVPLLFLGRVAAKDVTRIYPEIRSHLLFFAEWVYGHDGVVLEIPEDAEVFPTECPPRPEEADPLLIECRVVVKESVSLPETYRGPERDLYSRELLHFGETPDPFWGEGVRHPILEKLEYRSSIVSLEEPNRGMFRFGGYPLHVQAHPIDNANLNASTAGIADWCSLMSFGNDEACGLSYGDTGFCGFMTTRRAIESGTLSFQHFYQDSM
jgi:Domain of unknown function (DUF1963)